MINIKKFLNTFFSRLVIQNTRLQWNLDSPILNGTVKKLVPSKHFNILVVYIIYSSKDQATNFS